MKGLHVEHHAFESRIYAGRLNKSGDRWRIGKQDITSEALSAVTQLVRRKGGSLITDSYGVIYEIRVTKVDGQADIEPLDTIGPGIGA